MPDYKVTWIYSQSTGNRRVAGWSETWYNSGALPNIVATAEQAGKRRAEMLASNGVVRGYRVQEVGGRGRMYESFWPGVVGGDQDIPQMAVNCSCDGLGVPNVKRFQLRGVNDGSVVQGDYVPTQGFVNGFTSWGRYMQQAGYRFRCLVATTPPVRIISITNAGQFRLAAPVAMAVGSYIQVIRARTTVGTSASGTFFVNAVIDNMNGTFLGYDKGTVELSGTARVAAIQYISIAPDSFRTYRITTRKVGRPFDLYRGRALKR